jgi:CheY-like chemotaxis protein
VSLAEKNVYQLVLMDISMPRMDGLEASARIRKIDARLPIIAITAHAYEEDRKSILDAGMNDIILKPINENVLKKTIRSYLGDY